MVADTEVMTVVDAVVLTVVDCILVAVVADVEGAWLVEEAADVVLEACRLSNSIIAFAFAAATKACATAGSSL